jgi:hypothetical protein
VKQTTEIYHVVFELLHRDINGNRIVGDYTVGLSYDVANKSITPTSIKIVKDRVVVSFADGGSHSFKMENAEIFRRMVKEKSEIKTEDNGGTTED